MTATPSTTPARRRRSTTTDLALIASFAALIGACSLLPAIPIGVVPITLQTFAVILAGAVLGSTRGALAALLWLAVGLIGLPVFTGGGAGLAPLASPSVGYLVSFPIAAFVTGFIVERLPRGRIATSVPLILLAGAAASILVVYPLGALGMAWRAGLTLPEAFTFGLTFLPGDLLKDLLAAIVATSVHRAFPALLPRRGRAAARAAQRAEATPAAAA
ncbi:biotin transporter BioY [Leucobacter albus]|uniref:Biotin transporter n=1 Tax=Leucobacter albus TaxID=272210 RepID=A0ABW3TKT7_9MICO